MRKSKVLVTGGTGYIGSHTVVELINAGYEPVIVDNLSNSGPGVLNQIERITGLKPVFYQSDLCEPGQVEELFSAHPDISGVIHFAAFKAVGESVAEPLKYYRNNILSLLNVLEATVGREIRFVFSSSCTVYGEPDALPVTEDSPTKKAESPYGNTKKIAEDILFDACRPDAGNPGLKVACLRYFNPVGAHSSALIGELPTGIPANLVPFITQSAIGKRGPITVYGSDYNTPDGTCIRDYIHVVDLAKAHIAALSYFDSPGASAFDIFNVGTGTGHSVLEVIKTFEESTNVRLNYQIGPRRGGDIEKIFGNVDKANRLLGWKAELDLKEMMRSAWAWENYIRDNEHLLEQV